MIFFKTTSKTKHKGSPRFFQNYFKFKTKRVLKILSNCFKNTTRSSLTPKTKHKGPLKFFETTSKTRRRIREIVPNHFKNTRGFRDSFILLQKQDFLSFSLGLFKTTSKPNTRSPRDSFKPLQKQFGVV